MKFPVVVHVYKCWEALHNELVGVRVHRWKLRQRTDHFPDFLNMRRNESILILMLRLWIAWGPLSVQCLCMLLHKRSQIAIAPFANSKSDLFCRIPSRAP